MKGVTSKIKMHPSWLLLLALAMLAFGVTGCTQQDQSGSGTVVTADGTTQRVPDSVRTEAFSYWGLGSNRPIVYELSYPDRNGDGEEPENRTEQGVSSIVFDSAGDDVATFIVQRTGGLNTIGDQTVEARPEGIFTVSSSLGNISEPIMELPAVLEQGKTWSSEVELQLDAATAITESFNYRIEGMEPVTVPLGTFEAMRVSQSTTVRTKSADGSEVVSNVTGSIWYVRDIGIVKVESTIAPESGPAMNVSYQAIRYAEDDAG
ncbi:MAG: hypothetical protein ACK4P3_04870 [Fimbriimonadaceae bacterium]